MDLKDFPANVLQPDGTFRLAGHTRWRIVEQTWSGYTVKDRTVNVDLPDGSVIIAVEWRKKRDAIVTYATPY